MMRKIIQHQHLAVVYHLQTAAHAAKRTKRLTDFLRRHTKTGCRGKNGDRIFDVVCPRQGNEQGANFLTLVLDDELRALRLRMNFHGAPLRRRPNTEGHHLAEGARQHLLHGRIIAARNQIAVAGNDIDQPAKSGFNFLEIFKNVGVIVLDVVQDHQIRQVMKKFRAFVKKCGIIFIALQNEVATAAELEALPKIFRNAADEKARIHAGAFQSPRQQAARCGFAVRAGDDARVFAANEKLFQRFGQREITPAFIKHIFHLRVAARHGVADNDQIRRRLQMRRIEALINRNLLLLEKSTHRRINIKIGASEAITPLLEHAGERRHARSTNADKVNVL